MVQPGCLAFSGDGTRLFVAAFDYSGPPTFQVFDDPEVPGGWLTLTLSSKNVPYMGKITATAQLVTPRGTSNKALTITEATVTGRTFTASGTMNGSHSFAHTFTMLRNASFEATWTGDAYYRPAERDSPPVYVGSQTDVKMLGSYGTSGAYHLYHYSTSCVNTHVTGCPRARATVVPSNPGETLCFTTQQYVGGKWTNGQSLCGALTSESQADVVVYYSSLGIIGVPFRTQAHFDRSPANRESTSPWRYFKVTR